MYIESSARNVNDTARLISPVYDRNDDNTCFEFWYHMHGATTGSLRVYLKRVNETWRLQPQHALFIKSGNQGDRWYKGFVVLGVIDTEYQIVIEGVRGTSYISDIAIDDVKIIQNCNPDDELLEGETTTEEFLSSETPIVVESCENRCNMNDNRTSDWLITCDCDEGCYERNRCCPDFFDFCVSGTTDDVEPTTEFVETRTETTEVRTTRKIVTSTSTLPTTTIPKRTTTRRRISTVVKVTPKSTQPSTTTSTTTQKSTTKVVYVKPSDKPKESDFDEVPRTTVADVETPDPPIEPVEMMNDRESDKTFDHQKIEVKNDIHESNTKTVVFAVGVVFGVLFAMVGTTFVARRYQLCRCRRMNQSSNGDSQSDVRFLTSDEALDFNLDY